MGFNSGTRVGPYEIVSPLGAGGMGEVYRARDTRLDRIVAIKVLTGALATDVASRHRFEEEARAIAALNDPHICTIHDVGHEGDVEYLVLEYLEGETLAARLKRTGAMPVEDALRIAIQMSEALDRAQRAGIVHRDLKPGNVMLVRRAGAAADDVKLLDFGLASRIAAPRAAAFDASLAATMAPSMAATQPASASVGSGISGTLQYMAPEQLDGSPGDHRSDIFAFGCVLYEMLGGRKAFEANTAVTAVAAIMSSEPPSIPALASAHPFIDHLIRRCLEKDPERRWQNAGDIARELRWVTAQPVSAGDGIPAARKPWSRGRRIAAVAIAVVALIVFGPLIVLGGLQLFGMDGQDDSLRPLQLEVTTPPTDDNIGAVSPNGSEIAFIALKDHVPALWVRALDSLESRALPGTEGASFPFWSPDGASLGFFADNKLKRIDANGGSPIVLTDAVNARGGDWGPDATILFAPGVNAPIMRVPVRGGAVTQVTTLDAAVGPSHRRPQFLPDGKHFLFSSSLGQANTNGVYFGTLDKSVPPVKISDDDNGLFVPPATLLTIMRGTLLAYRFDPSTGKVNGEPATIAQGVTAGSVFGASRTDTAVLAYRHGGAQQRQLVWVDRAGTVRQKLGEPTASGIASPELSADERQVALFLHPGTGEDNDVWVFELGRYLGRPITTGPPADAHPVFDPDNQAVIFNTARSGTAGVTRFPVSGAPPQLLFATSDNRGGGVLAMTRDRRYVLMRHQTDATGIDLVAASLSDGRDFPVTQLQGDETEGQFSPDGKWVAFVSSISGRAEVFVQSFPDGASRTQVSTGGGTQVRWSVDGKEIYYLAPDSKLMAVAFTANGNAPDVKPPTALFQTHLANGNNVVGNKAQYAVSRDGRFLLNTVVEAPSAPIVVAVNWTRRLPK
ncbi:MAG TPA: protein kinase [Vicinamibacterales bacterium]|nr:protein kinase [Vicinamibacterales bacterium]